MPNGEFIARSLGYSRVLFLDAQSASASSPWLDMHMWRNKTFHANAIETGGKVEIMVRNDRARPADTTDGHVSLTLDPTVLAGVVDANFKWVKAKKTAGTTPVATTVICEAKL